MILEPAKQRSSKNSVTNDQANDPSSTRLRRVFRVASENGLTMLKYSQLIQKIGDFAGQVQISNGAISVDGRSMLELLQLGAILGTVLTVELVGRNAHQVMQRIETIFIA